MRLALADLLADLASVRQWAPVETGLPEWVNLRRALLEALELDAEQL
jgi:hypothetical protein